MSPRADAITQSLGSPASYPHYDMTSFEGLLYNRAALNPRRPLRLEEAPHSLLWFATGYRFRSLLIKIVIIELGPLALNFVKMDK